MAERVESGATGPERLYLQPECCASYDTGRLWCEHDEPVECENGVPWTEYVRADRVRKLERAARKVLDGLNARIEAAPANAVPVFHGIAELSAALASLPTDTEATDG